MSKKISIIPSSLCDITYNLRGNRFSIQDLDAGTVSNTYNASGLLTGIRNGNVYHGHNANAITYIPGNETADYSIGNQYRQLNYTYDDRGFIASRTDTKVNQTESYYYDELDRLESYTVNGVTAGSFGYDHAGNILTNSKVGTYLYGSNRPHAVNDIEGSASCPHPFVAVQHQLQPPKPARLHLREWLQHHAGLRRRRHEEEYQVLFRQHLAEEGDPRLGTL